MSSTLDNLTRELVGLLLTRSLVPRGICHPVSDPHDRHDYRELDRLSRSREAGAKATQTRVAVAILLFLDRHHECRTFDNCFEMGDGDEVVAEIIRHAKANRLLREAIDESWRGPKTDGLPDDWLATHDRIQSGLLFPA